FARLRGMYAFALWDAKRQAMLCARDPYGIKPFYFADDGRTLRFASQVKALLAGGSVSRTRDQAGVAGFYLFGSVPEPLTRYRAISALRAGTYRWFDARGAGPEVEHYSIARVFSDARERHKDAPTDPREVAAHFRAAVVDSIDRHLVGDVPVGAFLSSGVDSCSLVALMSERGNTAVTTVTLAFDALVGSSADEAPWAEAMAARYGTRHVTRVLGNADLAAARDAIFTAMDQPSIDGINSYLVSRVARDEGLKVAVSGIGGDELFGTYPSFRDVPRIVSAFGALARSPLTRRLWRPKSVAAALGKTRLSPKAAGLPVFGGSFAGAYFLRRGLFMPWELPAIMGEAAAEEGLSRLDPISYAAATLEPEPDGDYAKVAVLESSLYLRNQLLRDADWASMAHGLELRVPLVDSALLEALAPLFVLGHEAPNGIYAESRYIRRDRFPRARVNGKELLGTSPLLPLPAGLIARKKTGFFVPVASWLEGSASGLDGYKRIPLLANRHCQWARRLAYALEHDGAA
ncbi:MAG: asparagine synthetase B, partial [Myxococcales bacterium]|nr:asparagine synthetase B [Myxococcales bacterium]